MPFSCLDCAAGSASCRCEAYVISRDEIIDRARRSAATFNMTLREARAAYLAGTLGLEWDGPFLLRLLPPDDPFGLPVDATRAPR